MPSLVNFYIHVAYAVLFAYFGQSKVVFKEYSSAAKEIFHGNILICVNIGNTDCALPYLLRTLEDLECPDKCFLRLNFDNSADDVIQRVFDWSIHVNKKFNNITFYGNVKSSLNEIRFEEKLQLSPVNYALENGYDYLFVVRSDYLIVNKGLLLDLISKRKTIVAPLFGFPFKTYTSNFLLANMYDDGLKYYDEIANRQRYGCFPVQTVRDSYLIDLKEVNVRTFRSNDSYDSISCDADCVRANGFQLFVCNRELYGYRPQYIEDYRNNSWKCQVFNHLLLEYQLSGPNQTYLPALNRSEYYSANIGKKSTLGFDKVYVINLKRRLDRRIRIEAALDILNIEATIIEAYDGLNLTNEIIDEFGIQFIPDYFDPYNKRTMNFGEVACFLSHYTIWKDAEENGYASILVLEDDARFAALFAETLLNTLQLMKRKNIVWDMLYLGRKIMEKGEKFVDEVPNIVKPLYSHWTVAYVLTKNGIAKLLAQNPIQKMLPVDEYFPIMYGQQPNTAWSSYFEPRNLICYAFQPVIVQPTHYYGEPNYISDTEDTKTILIGNNITLHEKEPSFVKTEL